MHLTQSALNRLARKAGLKSMSGRMYAELRGLLIMALEHVLPKIRIYADHAGRKTVRSVDIKRAIQQLQLGTIHQHEEILTKCKARAPKPKEKHRWLKNARFYQKQSDCLYISKSAFRALLAEDSDDPMKWSPVALDQLQIYLEMALVTLLQDANLCAIHARRQTVQPNDIQLAVKLSRHVLFTSY